MFGESIGMWFYALWLSQGRPKDVRFLEFGPGKGTLMSDVLRTFEKLNKGTPLSLSVALIEGSPVLSQIQRKTLSGWNARWCETEEDIDIETEATNYVIAHEFFDALPIQRFEKTSRGWREYMVDLTDSGKLGLVLFPHKTPSSSLPERDAEVGTSIELCPESHNYVRKMSQLLGSTGGGLIADYGPSTGTPGNSLRGIQNNQLVSPFIEPGNVDLSADVDFANLTTLFQKEGCSVFGPVEQEKFLHEMGIGFRTDQLVHQSKGNKESRQRIVDAYYRLVGRREGEMGSVYKFLTFLPSAFIRSPPGFGGSVE